MLTFSISFSKSFQVMERIRNKKNDAHKDASIRTNVGSRKNIDKFNPTDNLQATRSEENHLKKRHKNGDYSYVNSLLYSRYI